MAVLLFCSSQLMTGAFCLMCLPTHFQIEFACRAGRHASQRSCVGRKRERNVSQVVHPHFRGDRYRRHLGSVASALSRSPFLEKIIRTPVGVFSKHSIAPKFSCTTIPDSRNAAATAADTSSSSLGRMRGPVWKSWIRDPYALNMEATCTPVAPRSEER